MHSFGIWLRIACEPSEEMIGMLRGCAVELSFCGEAAFQGGDTVPMK